MTEIISDKELIYYFAYGSNLHPLRIRERVPSAELFGSANVSGFRLAFNKIGIDGSSKCNLEKTNNSDAIVHGAIYKIKVEHKPLIDEYESLNRGYVDRTINVEFCDVTLNCFTYIAQQEYIDDALKPFHWYKRLVTMGANYLQFPQKYIELIETVESIADENANRRKQHERLIEQMEKLL